MRDSKQPEYRAGKTAGHELRVGEILNHLLDQERQGNPVNETDVRAQYPDFADELLANLKVVSDLKRPGDPIAQLVAQGVLTASPAGRGVVILGSYRIIGFLGRGGMGIVLQAYEDALNRPVALKLLRPELSQDPTALRRFAREAKAAGSLKHPNIVTVYAVGEHRGTHFLAMEYVEGSTLADLIRQQTPLPTEKAREVFRQILSGLAAAHGAGLIHRDIKSSNILLDGFSAPTPTGESHSTSSETASRSVKIADFGLARVSGAQTRMTLPDSVLGTPEYMSPEQARGDDNIDHRTDLYSAGVVLYEMLTGRTPFKSDKPSAVVHRILNEDPPDPRSLSAGADPGLSSLALRLIAKRPEDRFESAADTLTALDAGQRVPSIERRRRTVYRTSAWLTALVLSVVAVWVGVWLSGSRTIRDVIVNNADSPSEVLVKRGSTTEWELLYDFGRGVTRVCDVQKMDRDGDGRCDLVVACLQPPVDDSSVFGLSTSGERLWQWDPTPREHIEWPDYYGGTTRWCCLDIIVENLDSQPGDEIVVAARETNEYGCRISVIDIGQPEAEATSTFWHMGHINGIRSIRRSEDDRPLILAWGVNNKLDGFEIPGITLASPERPASYDWVPILVVLDPTNLNGLGPPAATPSFLPPAAPVAYAYLNLFAEEPGAGVEPWETGSILQVNDCTFLPENEPNGCLSFTVQSGDPHDQDRAVLNVDHRLKLLRVQPGRGEEKLTTEDDWRSRWRVIVPKSPRERD